MMGQADGKMVMPKRKKYLSLSTSLLIMMLVLVYAPLLLGSVYAIEMPYRKIKAQQEQLYDNYIAANQDIISSHFDKVHENATLLLDSKTICGRMRELSRTHSQEDKFGFIEPKELYGQIDTPLTYNNVSANRIISAITIFAGEHLAYYSLQYKTTEQALSRCVMINNQKRDQSTPRGMFTTLPSSSGYVYYVLDYRDIFRGEKYGTIVIEMFTIPTYTFADKNAHIPYYDYQVDISNYPGMEYFICNEDDVILFSSAEAQHGINYNYSLYADAIRQENGVGEKYVVDQKYISKQLMRVSFITPYESIYLESDKLHRNSILFFSAVGFLALLLIFCFKDFIEKPFKALRIYCQQFSFQPKIPPVFDPVFREVEEAQNVIKSNLVTIEEMQGVVMKSQIQMKDAEIQQLQAQINPHFLFNMLDVIGWQAVQDKSESVSSMIGYLGELLRSNILQSSQEKITIRQELKYIKNYLDLQQIRFEDRFTYYVNVDEEILDLYYIPKLSIQPIVENCVIHGFKNITHKGSLEITIWEDRDDIICKVKDDGCGFDAVDFFKRKQPNSNNPKLNHIALHNIQRRIQIMCGAEYGISIESEIGKGTSVTITLPIDDVNITDR